MGVGLKKPTSSMGETGREYSQVGRARVGFVLINDPCASLENYTVMAAIDMYAELILSVV